ncbi:phage tail tape measure protein [Stutzerimonas frequens]|uniref:Phage tail tape measure protein n=1 Tax=Stutzerimonas frequens TaxID=2968969 RepID=A0AA47HZK2_9GAMM|nr:phage tail tape measure protein [Stutzerimonas frequens]WAE53235.1 phage tail tape measure protein [Stutzerimonas frequens]
MATNSAALNFILKLTDQVSAPLGKVKMGFNELAEKGQDNIRQMGFGLAGMVGAGLAINESLQPALEMNRALGEVKSLGVAEDALQRLNDKALEFSVAYGANARDFVASAYDIQSAIAGLTGEQLSSFTNASNLLAKATKADAGTITSYVGTMYGIFKNQADAMGKAEWVENLTGQTALAVQMFKTTGKDMSDAFTSIGASATSAGIGLSEQVAILGTLQATMGGAEAGTKYKAFLSGVGGAQEKLGLSFTDSQGRMLPMLQILDKLKGKFGDTLDVAESDALKKAFGSDEAVGLIKLLMTDTTGLANSMEQLGNVHGLEQAEKMAKAMVDPWQQFGAAVQALRIAFGQALIPILTPLMERLTGIAGTMTRWAGLFPNITRLIGIATLVVFGLAAGIGAITFVVALAKTAWLGLSAVWTIATAAAWLFNAALWANPITWVVVGLIALGVAIGAAIIYWDEITAAIMNTAAFQWVSAQLTALSDWFTSLGGWSGMAKAAWDGILAIFYGAINGLIAMLNKIPGVEIDAKLGAMPEVPALTATQPPSTPAIDRAMRQALPSTTPAVPPLVLAPMPAAQAEQTQQRINEPLAGLAPQRANAVPPGGLLTSIQNTSNQDKGTRVEKVEIHTGKAMSPLELENMLGMAVGG